MFEMPLTDTQIQQLYATYTSGSDPIKGSSPLGLPDSHL